MSDVSDAGGAVRAAGLGRKAGPLPIWAWGVIIVGGAAVIYFFFIRKSSAASSGQVQDQNGLGLSQGQAGITSTAYGTGDTSTGSFANNQQWLQGALSALGGSSQYTPLQIQQAYGDLNSGQPLTTTEQTILNKIEDVIGPPPESTPSPTLLPPTPPAPPKPAVDNPYGVKTVYALGSNEGSQYIRSDGGIVKLTKQEVAAARSLGYGYQVQVVSNLKQVP